MGSLERLDLWRPPPPSPALLSTTTPSPSPTPPPSTTHPSPDLIPPSAKPPELISNCFSSLGEKMILPPFPLWCCLLILPSGFCKASLIYSNHVSLPPIVSLLVLTLGYLECWGEEQISHIEMVFKGGRDSLRWWRGQESDAQKVYSSLSALLGPPAPKYLPSYTGWLEEPLK